MILIACRGGLGASLIPDWCDSRCCYGCSRILPWCCSVCSRVFPSICFICSMTVSRPFGAHSSFQVWLLLSFSPVSSTRLSTLGVAMGMAVLPAGLRDPPYSPPETLSLCPRVPEQHWSQQLHIWHCEAPRTSPDKWAFDFGTRKQVCLARPAWQPVCWEQWPQGTLWRNSVGWGREASSHPE